MKQINSYNTNREASQWLANYIDSLALKTPAPTKVYSHMGATITDCILQAGMNYNSVVLPRINLLLEKFYDYRSTTDFILLIELFSLEELINFRNKRKTNCIYSISRILQSCCIENEKQLSVWIQNEKNVSDLQAIKGVGPKTIDYLKMLVGISSIAIDRHLFSFLKQAGINTSSYTEAKSIYIHAAELLKLHTSELDKMIWQYMSKNTI